jgi:hypothetical protein
VYHNHGPGLHIWGFSQEARISCSRFAFNGDTLPEVVVAWPTGLVSGNLSNCLFMDSIGTLLRIQSVYETNTLANGENGFYLLGGTGKYIEWEDGNPAVVDISNNYWYPVSPDSAGFLSFLSPDSAQYWIDSTHMDSMIICEEMRDALPASIIGHGGGGEIAAPMDGKTSGQGKTSSGLSGTLMPSKELESFSRKLAFKQAQLKQLKSLAKEGKFQQALSGYEEIIRKPDSKEDSVAAIISAMGLHLSQAVMKKSELTSSLPQYRISSVKEFVPRYFQLVRSLWKKEPLATNTSRAIPIPKTYKLYQNYPNPFNPVTEIRFDVPEKTRVELRIFNILGQRVTTLVDEVRTAGAYHILWDGKSAGGVPVSSGMYIYQLKCDKFVDAKKMILLR